ncbi:high mobility group protein B2-like isoform X2 [Astyanax mexicanus]|uniref:High mobility group protein B2 n=3 Tax=Astyanax mexicanus TaxID=7994 RepID=A0A8T2LD92_ASTMX|nr:high mobility group protein B2-like isoform X2 [Astyanax mexicanus]
MYYIKQQLDSVLLEAGWRVTSRGALSNGSGQTALQKQPDPQRVMVKDANKPKGRTSAYAFFVLSSRDELKKKSPGTSVNFGKFSKKCSEDWKALTPSEKKKFEDLAKADKARYDEEMKSYVPPKGMGKMGRKKKDPNAPKRPPSAFFIFCSEHRPAVKSEHPNLTIGEIAKKLGEKWSKLSTKDRSPFDQKAVLLREKYEKEVAAYRSGGSVAKRGPGRPTGSTKKAHADDDDDDDDEDDEDDDEEDDDEEDEDDE